MPRELPDLWEGCYDGEHRKMSPGEFKRTFCENCMNAGCRNSKGAGTAWVKRILTQEDRLLRNPVFARDDDPAFRDIRQMQFEDMIREALAIEISTKKGDWSVPTEAEIGQAAAELVGLSKPAGFSAEPKVEVTVTPEEAPKLRGQTEHVAMLDDFQERLPDERRVTGLDGKVTVESEGLAGISSDVVREDEKGFVPEGEWRVKGDSGNLYTVTLYMDGQWGCTCPSREVPCKHARDIARRLSRAPRETTPAPTPPEPPKPPPGLQRRPSDAPPPGPRSSNTNIPSEGLMIGGAPLPPDEEDDPWAPPKPKERVVPVGGRVSFGSGKKKP